MNKRILYILYIGMFFPVVALSQINTDRVMTIGKNALYFEDYVLYPVFQSGNRGETVSG